MSHLFRISARDHSAVILMTELARRHGDDAHVSLQEIAEDMGLSGGYLEEIAACLKKAGLIAGKQGPGGGYRLARAPKEIVLEDIVTALDGPIELVDCQTRGVACPVSEKCQSQKVWKTIQDSLTSTLRTIRLADVMK